MIYLSFVIAVALAFTIIVATGIDKNGAFLRENDSLQVILSLVWGVIFLFTFYFFLKSDNSIMENLINLSEWPIAFIISAIGASLASLFFNFLNKRFILNYEFRMEKMRRQTIPIEDQIDL